MKIMVTIMPMIPIFAVFLFLLKVSVYTCLYVTVFIICGCYSDSVNLLGLSQS
jgi:hypothetical protein